MEFVIQRQQGIDVEHLLLVGRRPEIEHHDLALRLRQLGFLAVHSGKFDVDIAYLGSILQLILHLQAGAAPGGFFFQRFHITGFRIDALERIGYGSEEDGVRGLVEYGRLFISFPGICMPKKRRGVACI